MNLVKQLDGLLNEMHERLAQGPVFSALLEGTISREHLVGLMLNYWHQTQAPAPMLALAAKTIALYASNDPRFQSEAYARFKTPLYERLRHEYEEHSRGEDGHDKWVFADLRALGVPEEQIRGSTPSPSMKAYLANFHMAVTSATPAGVSGIAFMLEGTAERIAARTVKNLRERSKIPNVSNAVSFFGGHAEADIGHMEEARARLSQVEDERDQRAILYNARVTVEVYCQLSHDVLCGF